MLLIFDLDGTLFQAKPVVLCAAEMFCRVMGVPLPQERFLYKNADTFLRTAAPGVAITQSRACYDEVLYKAVRRCGELYPGVTETLSTLKNEGHKLLIVSASGAGYIKLALEVTNIFGFFSGLYSAEGYLSKAELILKLISQGSTAVVIGDTHGDIEAAQACGLWSVAVMYGYGNKQMLSGADFFADSPGDIVWCIRQICKMKTGC